MRPVRPAFAIGALAALFVGGVALATSRNPSPSDTSSPVPAYTAAQPLPVAPAAVATPAAAPERVVVGERAVTPNQPRTVRRTRVVTKTRSGKKSALIIGGSAVGGAAIGGLVGGKKGAVIGGVVGGAGGTVYDRKTRKKKKVVVDE